MKRTALAILLVATPFLAMACNNEDVVRAEPTYDSCSSTTDCASELDTCVTVTSAGRTGASCTRACASDAECPEGGHCASVGGDLSQCYLPCVTSDVCTPGWACTPLSDGTTVCLPGSRTPAGIPAYATCTRDGDACDASLLGCFTITADEATASICTSTCSRLRPCPGDGECVAFDGVYFTCFQGCDTSDDCLVGFACKSSLADGTTFPPICLPI